MCSQLDSLRLGVLWLSFSWFSLQIISFSNTVTLVSMLKPAGTNRDATVQRHITSDPVRGVESECGP